MDVLTQAAQFILSLSILIVLHELGHFVPAKLFKTRVEKFYLFFDPWFSLFKIKRGETEYGIGWLPLGGYVKISGMIDESMDKEQMKQAPQPWEFRSKPAWQRLIIMVGGVTVNVILGILIFAMVLFIWGKQYLPTENAKYGIAADSLAIQTGLRDGDKILSVDHQPVESFTKIPLEIILNRAQTVQVDRDGQKLSVPIHENVLTQLIKGKHTTSFIEPRFPCEIDSVAPGTAADKSGLKKGDKVTGINDKQVVFYQDVVKELKKNKGQPIALKVQRSGEEKVLQATVSPEGKLGFMPKGPAAFLELKTKQYGFFESFPAGLDKTTETIKDYWKQLKVLFTVKDAHKSIGGFISIGKAYDTDWNWLRFWEFTAFLSIVLAFMNILPIPALDGGHVLFLLYEVITRRKPNEKFMEYAQYAGMLLLLALILYANGNDIVRVISE